METDAETPQASYPGSPCALRSRLKGMETNNYCYETYIRNTCALRSRLKGMETFDDRFSSFVVAVACALRSRLKGMETPTFRPPPDLIKCLCSAFPFEGNGNLVACIRFETPQFLTCAPLSRLKGMETFHIYLHQVVFPTNLRSTFPFKDWRLENPVNLLFNKKLPVYFRCLGYRVFTA